MSQNPRYTVNEVAEKLDVEREVARGLVRFLVDKHLASLRGERKPESGRGKAENVYSFADDFEKRLGMLLKRAALT
jgi:predicted ArsR family transcriptional regulator